MPVRVEDIVEALASLGGEAHNADIEAVVTRISPPPLPTDVGAVIRARIQERCADAQSYKGGEVLFESVHGVNARKGVWRLLEDPLAAAAVEGFVDPIETEIEAEEWRSQLRIHLRRERSKALVTAFKASLVNMDCEVCGFNFEHAYGQIGVAFIEAHHTVQVAKLKEGQKTTMQDLVALCSNCHRMAHRRPDLSVDELRKIWSN